MSKYPNERIIYLDIAKGIGILLVVLGHLNLEFVFKNIIYSFHMPLFFYLGGVVSLSRNEIPWHNIKKFLFLYLMFGFCFACIIMIQNRSFDIELIYDMFKSNPISIYNIKWFGVFWFILAYSIVLILSKIKNFQSILVYFLLFFIIFYYFLYERYRHHLYAVMYRSCTMFIGFLWIFFVQSKNNELL